MTWPEIIEQVCRDAREAVFTEDSVRYLRVHNPNRMMVYADRIWECCDNGRRLVFAIESERIVLIQHAVDNPHYDDVAPTYWWEIDFLTTEDAYEDRLDELATVAVPA